MDYFANVDLFGTQTGDGDNHGIKQDLNLITKEERLLREVVSNMEYCQMQSNEILFKHGKLSHQR